jgi:L-threonylcarbamoyladenylate synthase
VRTLDDRATAMDEAVRLLDDGQVVGIPTDTVYGLAARLEDEAIKRLFAAKRRPSSVPVAVLCGSLDDAVALSASWPPEASTLAASHWPGPLTLVVAADPALVARLGGAGGLGVRVPDDGLCRTLLERTGPLAVTSANLHGAPPATCAADLAALGDDVAAVLDGGTRDGAVSSVLDLTGPVPVVLRAGAIAADVLLAAISPG